MIFMKVLLINGSPHPKGCTYTALSAAADELNKNGIDTEIIQVGAKPIVGCIGCGACGKLGKCQFGGDPVNETAAKCAEADGIIVGTPVHYAASSGAVKSFMDRLFYSAGKNLTYKPAAAVASCRRGGASAALDQINKYFTINQMPIVSSNYWNMVHGSAPEQVLEDKEGIQTMRLLGRNMAWLIKAIDAAKQNGINHPDPEPKEYTNFIR